MSDTGNECGICSFVDCVCRTAFRESLDGTRIVPSQSQITKTHERLAVLQSSRMIELMNERDELRKEVARLKKKVEEYDD